MNVCFRISSPHSRQNAIATLNNSFAAGFAAIVRALVFSQSNEIIVTWLMTFLDARQPPLFPALTLLRKEGKASLFRVFSVAVTRQIGVLPKIGPPDWNWLLKPVRDRWKHKPHYLTFEISDIIKFQLQSMFHDPWYSYGNSKCHVFMKFLRNITFHGITLPGHIIFHAHHKTRVECEISCTVPDSSFVTHESQAWHFILISDSNCTQEMPLFL